MEGWWSAENELLFCALSEPEESRTARRSSAGAWEATEGSCSRQPGASSLHKRACGA